MGSALLSMLLHGYTLYADGECTGSVVCYPFKTYLPGTAIVGIGKQMNSALPSL